MSPAGGGGIRRMTGMDGRFAFTYTLKNKGPIHLRPAQSSGTPPPPDVLVRMKQAEDIALQSIRDGLRMKRPHLLQLKFAAALLISLYLLLSACNFFKKKSTPEKDAVARVNDEYLYLADVLPLTKGLKGQDSIAAIKNYTEGWIRKKLLLEKANENIPDDDPGITKKIDEYRGQLVLYEYEKALINKRLDTVVKQEELEQWYAKMKAGLPLQNDVYQLYFIKLKKDAPQVDDMRKWLLKPKDDEDKRKLEGYYKAYSTSYSMDEGIWYETENVLKNFPLTAGDMAALTASGNFKEFKSPDGLWFIKISGMLKNGQSAPLDFVRDQVVKAVIEHRRVELVEKIYDKIYKDGIKSKSFEIFAR